MGGCLQRGKDMGPVGRPASMTVFFCLILLLISALICTCLESARTAGLRFMAKTASDSALQSVFADYHEQLWEDYHVFFHHEERDMAEALGEYLAYYENPAKGIYGVSEYDDLWGLTVEAVSVTGKQSALSDGGRLFLEQAVEYEKYQIAESLLEMLLDRADVLGEVDKIRSFAVRLSGCFEQIQRISTLYQDVRDGIAAVKSLGSQIKALFAEGQPELEEVRVLLSELSDKARWLKQLAEDYLVSAEEIGSLADDLTAEYGANSDTVYGQQIDQLRAFALEGLLGGTVGQIPQKADEMMMSLASVLEEIGRVTGEGEDEAVEDEYVPEGGAAPERGAEAEAVQESEGQAEPEREAESDGGTESEGETAPEGGSKGEAESETESESAKETGAEMTADQIVELYERITETVTLGISLMQELDSAFDQAERSAEDGDSEVPGVDSDIEEDDSDFSSGEPDAGESLLELVKQFKNMAVLSLVMGEGALGTRADYFSEPQMLPSVMAEETLDNVTAEEKGLFIFYITDTFTNVLSGRQEEFAYQQEYILFGKNDSRSNLTAMAERLLAIREGLNLAFLLTNTQMRTLAGEAAYALVGATGVYPLVLLTQFVILAAWAFAESVADVRQLFAGERVVLWKTEETWNTSISGLIGSVGSEGAAQSGDGALNLKLSYEEYLMMFLLISDTQTLCLRSMDVIQQEIGCDETGFLMSDCCGAAEATVRFSSPYRLITLPLIGLGDGTGHQIQTVSSYQYR